MPDIIVTTPKSQMRNAALEAEHCKQDGGGFYFRRLAKMPAIKSGNRVFYVEDGFIRGFAMVERTQEILRPKRCDTTGIWYEPGSYIFMRADSWKWIRPITMSGFQGYRYTTGAITEDMIEVVGDWLDPKPLIFG